MKTCFSDTFVLTQVVKFAQSHTKHATSRKYGIARRVISRWIADKEVLQTDLMNATQHVLNESVNDEIDMQLLKWYKEIKKTGRLFKICVFCLLITKSIDLFCL